MSNNLGDEKLLEDLIKNGANVNARNEFSATLLDMAARYSNIQMESYRIKFCSKGNTKHISQIDCLLRF